ncbi:hypothetical protein TIFTF001_027801 [Ficus carica]|uniref:Uncharacterized protein n=1 Tax=Ficus carica TaxID=3494 RepID=A0AA88J0N6_FICCA|nr:hypothetical protein TIFTF001_027801 [Ficus carica]
MEATVFLAINSTVMAIPHQPWRRTNLKGGIREMGREEGVRREGAKPKRKITGDEFLSASSMASYFQ